jgi:histidinol-phosphate aminotransferase
VQATIRDRYALAAALAASGLEVAPSQGNFVLVRVGASGRAVYEALLRRGVIVRPMPPPLESWVRVTVGRPPENERFLQSLHRVLGESRAR